MRLSNFQRNSVNLGRVSQKRAFNSIKDTFSIQLITDNLNDSVDCGGFFFWGRGRRRGILLTRVFNSTWLWWFIYWYFVAIETVADCHRSFDSFVVLTFPVEWFPKKKERHIFPSLGSINQKRTSPKKKTKKNKIKKRKGRNQSQLSYWPSWDSTSTITFTFTGRVDD